VTKTQVDQLRHDLDVLLRQNADLRRQITEALAARRKPMTRADVEPLWTATSDRDDWAHIVAFANAVRRT
jgi:hypothetical protein